MSVARPRKNSSQADISTRTHHGDGRVEVRDDIIAVEEPLEIRIGFTAGGTMEHRAVSITMRTPGNDFELAAGFLFTEGILKSPGQVAEIRHCGKFPNNQNTVRLDLKPGTAVELKKLERNFYMTSSCGVCGKTSLEALFVSGAHPICKENLTGVSASTIHGLPEALRTAQQVFEDTGGLHAAGIFSASGELLDAREDVGRHNAVDKLIGARFLAEALPCDDAILFLSGRASFELVQKAVMARFPIVCAVGAPSSLAVSAAREFGVTLLGFVRENRFNIYSGEHRIRCGE